MSARDAIYLDANAGAPLSLRAREALQSFLTGADSEQSRPFSLLLPNPSSIHALGRRSKKQIEEARSRVAQSIGAKPQNLIFTSSGTASCQIPIRTTLDRALTQEHFKGAPQWILSAGEHEAVKSLVEEYRVKGVLITWLPLTATGAPDLDHLERILSSNSALVSLIWVNNETGVITDIERLTSILHPYRTQSALQLHLDAAQAWGKIPVNASSDWVDWLSFSGHKIGGWPGTGAVWFGSRARPNQDLHQGTENIMCILALGAAASELCSDSYFERVKNLALLRDRLEADIAQIVPGTKVHSKEAPRVSNTTNLGFEGLQKGGLVMALDLAGYCVSAGAACSSGLSRPSAVLKAMGLSDGEAISSIRISLSLNTKEEELLEFPKVLSAAVQRMRGKND
jgi:cysteine desulfurase